MKRALSIILSVLLGALAVAIGMGIFLDKANTDRERLTEIAIRAQQDAKQIQETNERTILEANKKLDAATLEVQQAQERLRKIQEEKDLIAKATPLIPPTAATLKTWKDAISVPFGVSLKYPPIAAIETNDEQSLVLSRPTGTRPKVEPRIDKWLMVVKYDPELESSIRSSISSSTPVTLMQRGHVLTGITGFLPGGTSVLFVTTKKADAPDRIIWIREPDTLPSLETAMSVLSTFDFKD